MQLIKFAVAMKPNGNFNVNYAFIKDISVLAEVTDFCPNVALICQRHRSDEGNVLLDEFVETSVNNELDFLYRKRKELNTDDGWSNWYEKYFREKVAPDPLKTFAHYRSFICGAAKIDTQIFRYDPQFESMQMALERDPQATFPIPITMPFVFYHVFTVEDMIEPIKERFDQIFRSFYAAFAYMN